MNPLDTAVADEFVRVRSAGCTTDCDAADVYRLSAFETTGFVPRFNNSGTQITVLVLQNLAARPSTSTSGFWSRTGPPRGTSVQTLGPRASYVLNTSTIVPGCERLDQRGEHGPLRAAQRQGGGGRARRPASASTPPLGTRPR